MALRIVQNAARPKIIAAPRRLPRLLERLISSRALHTGRFLQRDLYSAPIGDALIIPTRDYAAISFVWATRDPVHSGLNNIMHN
jgi:hypothetical protein